MNKNPRVKTSTLHTRIDPKKKTRLQESASKRGKKMSVVLDALIDMYLEWPEEKADQLLEESKDESSNPENSKDKAQIA